MIQLYQKITQLTILELFIKNPYERYYLREASRMLEISPMTVKRALDLLVKDRMLLREEFKNQVLYKGNMENPAFKHLKVTYNLAWLEEKGIVDYLKENLAGLSSLILYGSFAKGENDEKSDIDLLAISSSIGHRLRPPFIPKSLSIDMRIKCLALINIHYSLKSSLHSIVSKYKS